MIDSTASASPSDSSSAPSGDTGTSSPSSTPDSRPSSFSEALTQAAGDPGTPDPTSFAPDSSTPAPAIAEPNPLAPDVATAPPAKGPIPYDRHEAVLKSTRDKTAHEVVSRVQQQYGGAIQLQQRMASDPVGTMTQLIDEAVAHPEMGQAIISSLARTLAARRSSSSHGLQPIDTEVGAMYTADQVQTLVDQTIAQRLQPFEQEREAQRAEITRQHAQAEMTQTVRSRLSHWQAQPGFTGNEREIAAKQAALVDQGVDTWSALGLAYAAIVPSKLQAQSTTQFVQDAARKAHASTGNPATVGAAVRPRPTTFRDALTRSASNTL